MSERKKWHSVRKEGMYFQKQRWINCESNLSAREKKLLCLVKFISRKDHTDGFLKLNMVHILKHVHKGPEMMKRYAC